MGKEIDKEKRGKEEKWEKRQIKRKKHRRRNGSC